MKTYTPQLIIALAVILTAFILGNSYKNRNSAMNSISVTGLASVDFKSDLIVWRASYSQYSENLQSAYAQLNSNKDSIVQYLKRKGVSDSSIVFNAVNIEKINRAVYNTNGEVKEYVFAGYSLSQSVEITSKEIDKIELVSRESTELINKGIEFNSMAPEFFYTQLATLKIEMIEKATQDARIRAEKIASNSKGGIGSLKNASMGVFQIVGLNSNEDYSWGGSFNTSSKMKTASVTVSLEYESN